MKKLHWGHKIGIVYGLFVAFMLLMLFLSSRKNHELVTENYYERELAVQKQLVANSNFKKADFKVSISAKNGEIRIRFTGLEPNATPEGKVVLYKPDDSRLDRTLDVILNEADEMIIDPPGHRGRYKVSVSFHLAGVDYFTEKPVFL